MLYQGLLDVVMEPEFIFDMQEIPWDRILIVAGGLLIIVVLLLIFHIKNNGNDD